MNDDGSGYMSMTRVIDTIVPVVELFLSRFYKCLACIIVSACVQNHCVLFLLFRLITEYPVCWPNSWLTEFKTRVQCQKACLWLPSNSVYLVYTNFNACDCDSIHVIAIQYMWLRFNTLDCVSIHVIAIQLMWLRFNACDCDSTHVIAIQYTLLRFNTCDCDSTHVIAIQYMWLRFNACDCESIHVIASQYMGLRFNACDCDSIHVIAIQ